MKDIKFDLDDILIKPAKTSRIKSRNEINILHNGFLPLITAPMDTIVSGENYKTFLDAKINVCLPRGEKGNNQCFESYSLNEIKENISTLKPRGKYLIDIANGHMEDLVDTTKVIKAMYKDITLMVGNIANPLTYKVLSDAGADYVRCSIGSGNGCLTSQQTAIGYPMGSLIKECYTISETLDKPAKIVADGGMKKYSDIIKALAIGADYVMVGSLLNKTIESSGENYLFKFIKLNNRLAKFLYKNKITIYKKYRGMSTKEVQRKWGNKDLKTSEGVTRIRKVEYTLDGWVSNFTHYLKSTMSYCNAKELNEYIGYAKYNLISLNSYHRFKK